MDGVSTTQIIILYVLQVIGILLLCIFWCRKLRGKSIVDEFPNPDKLHSQLIKEETDKMIAYVNKQSRDGVLITPVYRKVDVPLNVSEDATKAVLEELVETLGRESSKELAWKEIKSMIDEDKPKQKACRETEDHWFDKDDTYSNKLLHQSCNVRIENNYGSDNHVTIGCSTSNDTSSSSSGSCGD